MSVSYILIHVPYYIYCNFVANVFILQASARAQFSASVLFTFCLIAYN